MRLNYDLIREIMLDIEMETDGYSNISPRLFAEVYFKQYDEKVILYHILYLRKAMLIEPLEGFEFIDITPKGHEFLNNIRNDDVWEKAKEKVYSCASSVSLSLLAQFAKEAASKAIGL